MIHVPVLLQESIEALEINDGDIVVDATLGDGGHSQALAGLGKKIQIIAIDLDADAIKRSKERLMNYQNIIYVESNFRDLDKILDSLQIKAIQKVLFDFGMSSSQLEESGRGFSFQKNEPLLMTMSSDQELNAAKVINEYSENDLRQILRTYGEERWAGRIARKIVEERRKRKIETTRELVEIIERVVPGKYKFGRIHPATKTFQALRIFVNDELASIEEGLSKAFSKLSLGGRIAAISFHSLEDRIVKHLFRAWENEGLAKVMTKKPIMPTAQEIEENPRSRSAKLRIVEKVKV